MKKLLFIVTLALLVNCSKQEATYTVEVIDGVKHIHNLVPMWSDKPHLAELELEFVQKIGGLNAVDDNYIFNRPEDLVVDEKGNIYLIDALDCRILVFDKSGKYHTTIGRKGEGPGEFKAPVCAELDYENNLYVSDIALNRIIIVTKNNIELRRIDMSPQYFWLSQNGEIFSYTEPDRRLQAKNITEELKLICVFDTLGNFMREFGSYKNYNNEKLTYFGNSFKMDFDNDGNICVVFDDQNRIEKYSPDGTLLFCADRPLNFEIGLDKDRSKFLSSGEFLLAQFYPVSENIQIDHKNRIWVHAYKKLREENDKPLDYFSLELYSSDGILLMNFDSPVNFTFMRIYEDRMFFIDRKEEMCIYEYKIVELEN
jgi:sugar lactone lactonase YvrE